ncbi:hypothetical protein ACPUVO_17295 [Pseudocolwellia sp. HL-MZ19]|uniref:hypothetical protein n=1 Tax=unclassified Pseudocolwellia TaxID=2848178 RepID=UPI003CF096C4
MKEWESTMIEAKQAFNDKVFSAAIFLNKHAVDIAISGFNENVVSDAEKAVASVMVSYFSLADSYIAIRDFKQAYNMYQLSFSFLQTLNQEHSEELVISRAVSHGISHLKIEWSLFVKDHQDKITELNPILGNAFQTNLHTLTSPSAVVH